MKAEKGGFEAHSPGCCAPRERGRGSDAAILNLSPFPLYVSLLMVALGSLASLLPAAPLPAGDLCGLWLLLVAARSPALQWTHLPH